jgi:hypothetical protein
MAESLARPRRKSWRSGLFFALPIMVVVLGLFYFWFAIADRYVVFLYEHDMGSVVADTSPFSNVTGSRYWMAGLVAGGAVLVLYTGLHLLLGRLLAGFRAPPWWQVWVLSAPWVLVGIPAITMTVNSPTLPPGNAAQATLATLIALALALLPGRMAAERPGSLIWLSADACWLMLVFVAVVGLQNLPRWLASGGTLWARLTILMLAIAVPLLVGVSVIRYWCRTFVPSAQALLVAGFCLTYLILPLAHHVAFTDGYYYITNSSNFLADSVGLQMAAWMLGAGLALVATQLREAFAARRRAPD